LQRRAEQQPGGDGQIVAEVFQLYVRYAGDGEDLAKAVKIRLLVDRE